MRLDTALKLVVELAEQNVLSEREASETPELAREYGRQQKAIDKVRKFIDEKMTRQGGG